MSFGIFVFIFGAIIGSFLNVVALRFNTGFSLGGRSKCFSCSKTLHWYELVPIVSFIFQKGKCRGCYSKISWQYPIVETLTGLIFLATFNKIFSPFLIFSFPNFLLLTFYFITFSLLIVISIYDLKHKIIPDELVYTFIVISFIKMVFLFVFFPPILYSIFYILSSVLAGPILFLPFFLLWLVSRGRWMGFGDAKLALGIGWFLGLTSGISALFIAFYSGALVGVGMIAFQQFLKKFKGKFFGLNMNRNNLTMKSEIPFGPFLILGLLLVFFFKIDFFNFSLLVFK